ncbi:AraC family transcriptional regulator [Neorhizobium lilium]|uniref:AraC family transcriptional regulator n=1 Tax=Neorhizobium lilium TaxID=2503024 RepID=UPI001FDF8C12|nr:AraC family transcriptional regulator [Neorhizobium lilium]
MENTSEDSESDAELVHQSITRGPVQIVRLSYNGYDLPPRASNPKAEAFGIISQLIDFKKHRLWRGGSLVYEGGHPKASLAITDLRDEWSCHHLSPFDNVRFVIPSSYIRDFARDVGRPEFHDLRCPAGTQDTVVLGLATALLPVLGNPQSGTTLFVEQIILAMMTHLAQSYGGLHFPSRLKGTLAPWQEKRAIDFLSAHMTGDFSIDDVAKACELSRSYFIKAFKETFGKTPYRWLIEYRVARAKDLLTSEMSLAEIATACGFADQSHMTRIFSQVLGTAPGHLRRFMQRK